ncbi:MAG: septal ring lytic transglycosylase RlpA family protein [Flavitalea sp.]
MKTILLLCSILLFRTAGAHLKTAELNNGKVRGKHLNEFFAYPSGIVSVDTSGVPKKAVRVQNTSKIQFGVASFYHSKFEGRKTSSGQVYDGTKYTAAHNSLPLGTWVRVTNLRNKRSVMVKINDRLHHRNTRLIDLSKIAAKDLGYIGRGLTKVKLEVLGKKKPKGAIDGGQKKPADTKNASSKKSS